MAAAKPVTIEEELSRLRHVLPAVVPDGRAGLDRHAEAEIAYWALGQGARIVNDVWGIAARPEHGPRGR